MEEKVSGNTKHGQRRINFIRNAALIFSDLDIDERTPTVKNNLHPKEIKNERRRLKQKAKSEYMEHLDKLSRSDISKVGHVRLFSIKDRFISVKMKAAYAGLAIRDIVIRYIGDHHDIDRISDCMHNIMHDFCVHYYFEISRKQLLESAKNLGNVADSIKFLVQEIRRLDKISIGEVAARLAVKASDADSREKRLEPILSWYSDIDPSDKDLALFGRSYDKFIDDLDDTYFGNSTIYESWHISLSYVLALYLSSIRRTQRLLEKSTDEIGPSKKGRERNKKREAIYRAFSRIDKELLSKDIVLGSPTLDGFCASLITKIIGNDEVGDTLTIAQEIVHARTVKENNEENADQSP